MHALHARDLLGHDHAFMHRLVRQPGRADQIADRPHSVHTCFTILPNDNVCTIHLDARRFQPDIFDIADADFVPKPAAANYDRFFERHAVDPARAVMFEDLAKNLIIPHERGMTTVLVVPKPGQMDHRDAFETAPGEATSYIDFVTSDLARFLKALASDAPDTADV